MYFTATTIPSEVTFCQRDSKLHNSKAIFWHYFTRKEGPFQWFGGGGLFGFVFLKLQTSFSPVPRDRGSMTLKEFVTDKIIFSSTDKSRISIRKMVHRKHTYSCYYNFYKIIIGVQLVIGLFLPTMTYSMQTKIMCSSNLFLTKIKHLFMDVNFIKKFKEGYFIFFFDSCKYTFNDNQLASEIPSLLSTYPSIYTG